MIGRTLSHFEITARLGSGGMGEVYRATDTRLRREVAVKLLPVEFTEDDERLARFRREAHLLAALHHPNIVTIHSIEELEGRHLLVMELVEGATLGQVISPSGLPLERFFRIAIQLAGALAAAHDKGVTHRDLKPGNVMLTAEDQVKLLDLGIAKLRPEVEEESAAAAVTEPVTQTGALLGTVRYMSPEQAQGRAVDERSDVFSLGIVLYEMLTGKSPFRRDSTLAILNSILHDEPAAVSSLRDGLPGGLERILRRCLEKDPGRRFADAGELLAELRRIWDESREAPTVAAGAAAAAPAGPRRRLLVVAALIALLATAGYLILRRPPTGPDSEPVPASTASGRATIAIVPFTVRGSPEFDYLGEGIVDLLSTKLDGAGELRSVDPNAVLSFVSQRFDGALDPAAGRAIARHFQASLYVVGEIVEAGGGLHVTASLYRGETPEALSKASVEGPAERLFELVDELAAELLAEQLSGPGAEFTRIAAVTTESLPALKSYLQGESELRGGRFTTALETFQKTLELDPEFALAWYRLSVAAEWAIRNDLVEAAAREAVRLSDRLSDHYQSLLAARLASREARVEEAERRYRAILGTHPDDVEAWSQLAEVLSHYSHVTGRSMTESREAWERVLELEPDFVPALWHLARIEAIERRETELTAVADRILALAPEAERAFEIRAIRAFAVGTAEEQRQVLEGLARVNDSAVALVSWNLTLIDDEIGGARAAARELLRPRRSTEARSLGHVILAHLAVAGGRWREARAHLSGASEVAPHLGLEHRALLSSMSFLPVSREELQAIRDDLLAFDAEAVPPSGIRSFFFSRTDQFHPPIRRYLLGRVSARLGDPAALDHAAALTEAAAASPQPAVVRNLARGVQAAWWLARDDPARAFAELEAMESHGISYDLVFASPFFSQPHERLLRGRLAIGQGRPAAAHRWLSTLSEVSYFDEAMVPLSHLYRGELSEQQGDPVTAAGHYRRFLELWSGADPELGTLLDGARARLAALEPVG